MPEIVRRPVVPSDLLTFKNVGDARITPDGLAVAFVVGDPVKTDAPSPKSRVWLVPTTGGPAREFTTGPRSDYAPRWSPDGQTLAFLSDRGEPGTAQIYLISRNGGEAVRLTEGDGDLGAGRGSEALEWSPDGRSIAYLARDPESAADSERKREKNDALVVEENERFVRLWVVDIATRETRAVSPPGVQIWEFSWSPAGDRFALAIADSPEEWSWYRARVAWVPSDGGEVVEIYASSRQVARPVFSPDGRHLALIESVFSDRGVIAGDLIVAPLGDGAARNLTDGLATSASWVEWSADGKSLLVLAHEDGGQSLFEIGVQPGPRTVLWSDQCGIAEPFWPRFSRAREGALAVAREDPTNAREIWVGRRSGSSMEWTPLTSLNAHAGDFAGGTVESVRWHATDGLAIQGFLVRPVDAEPGRRYPLVTWVHGGPTSAYNARYYGAQTAGFLAARGVAVFLPNPRGSVGWGRAFAEANVGDLGGKDFADIMTGIDYLVEQGVADPDRLGVGGWSYGGFMTAWVVSQSSRFKAAVMGAGIANWRSFHGVSHLTTWDAMHFNADPYEAGKEFDRFSPIAYVKQVRTPTLIVHGEQDHDVPVGQSYEFFRALKDLGVETRLVVYPREGHGFSERAHVLDLAERVVEWFTSHL